MNMNAIKRDPYHDYHRHVRPRAGLLLMWPAHVSYFLHPNRSHAGQPAGGFRRDSARAHTKRLMDAGQEPDWRPKFLDLWPTVLIRHKLARLRETEQAPGGPDRGDGRRPRATDRRYQGVDFLAVDDSAVEWLRAAIETTVAAYFRESGMDYPIRWTIQSWPNINRRGDYHPPSQPRLVLPERNLLREIAR